VLPRLIEDAILGAPTRKDRRDLNLASIVALFASQPPEVGGMTVNRFCGSSMSVIQIAAATRTKVRYALATQRIGGSRGIAIAMEAV
jgi:hypothetical protein